jgi:hypothetical protein
MTVQTAPQIFEDWAIDHAPLRGPHRMRGHRVQQNGRRKPIWQSVPQAAIFRAGSRICLASDCRHPDFLPGEVGVVLLVLHPSMRGVPLYEVRRARDGREATCYEDELIPSPDSPASALLGDRR